jgi:hypothetical protein
MTTLVLSRWYRCALMLTFAALIPESALAKGGTNMHEMASSRHDDRPVTNWICFTGCGCGRYHNYRIHKRIIPAHFWR